MQFITLLLRSRLLRLMSVSLRLLSPILPLYGGSLCAQEVEHHRATRIEVQLYRDTLTVDVRNAPLAQVLHAIGAQAGIAMTVRGDVSRPVTQAFTSVPLA